MSLSNYIDYDVLGEPVSVDVIHIKKFFKELLKEVMVRENLVKGNIEIWELERIILKHRGSKLE